MTMLSPRSAAVSSTPGFLFFLLVVALIISATTVVHAQSSSIASDSSMGSSSSGSHKSSSSTAPSTESPTETSTTEAPVSIDTLLFLQQFPNTIPALRDLWTGRDCCTWKGITCENGSVTIRLENEGLAGELPGVDIATDAAQVNVVGINLPSNPKITGKLPESWSLLTQLKYIVLSETSVTGTLPLKWGGMSNLVELTISSAHLCGGMPNWNMPSLQFFDISGNKMGGTLSPSFGSMSSLTTVHIQGNNFCGCVPKSWETNDVLSAVKADLPKRLTSQQCGVMNRCTANSNRCAFKSGASGPVGTALLASVATAAAMLLWVS